MKYDVTRACGHQERVELTGPTKRREWALERMEQGDCSDCVDAQRQKENAENAAAAQAAGWPALTGSERQVAWAETIRAAAVVKVRESATWWPEKYPEVTGDPAGIIEAAMLAQTSASWWIDNRGGEIAAAVALAAADVARALGMLKPLERDDLGPHVLVRPLIELPVPASYGMRSTVRAALCSCGWLPENQWEAAMSARDHIESLSEEEREAIRRAHPQDEPHACTEGLGLRKCLMRPYLRR
ncbi:hypothetical protein [Streptomyces griseomycini]|uniref:Uncharacterized protein n=1 Tax=Streptomyces griseomycini TaxID=66895 RepID=A0A7W7PWK6_9ACTN|nr:hypothetical protein [Streptomyces griseomycini]MBB4902605.1 hypothetical protein [Streptomyces griseomycini]GGR54411.1 hypothetical protein GCM10015536_69750 [Streptomyces griseomycini]